MELAKYIDQTALKPETTPSDVEKLCSEALEYRFAAVCVNPVYVPLAARILKGSGVLTATVAGFPLGASASEIKARESAFAVEQGAGEVDMVMAVGLFKGGDRAAVGRDIAAVVKAVHDHPVKVIIETCFLNRDEIIEVCRIAADNGAAFVKTSTGFGPRGASVEDVIAMKEAVEGRCRIKASGGIRTREQALAMIAAGATRIGTSAGVTIVKAES